MDINVNPVAPGTYKFQVFQEGAHHGLDPYIISGLIEPDGLGGCWITNVQGDMSNQSNELMAITVRDMGFEYLRFYVIRGVKVTHYATYTHSDEVFDYYRVQLRGEKTDDGK